MQNASANLENEILLQLPLNGAEAYNDSAIAAIRLIKLDEAEARLEKAMQLAAGAKEPFLNTARLYLICGEKPNARRIYERYSKANPAQIGSLPGWLFAHDREAEAVMLAEMLPDSAEANLWLGHYLLGPGNLEQASAAFQRALRIDPDLHAARLELGRIYSEAGQYERALPYLKALPESNRKKPEVQFLLANAYYSLNQFAEALRLLPEYPEKLEEARLRGNILLVQDARADLFAMIRLLPEKQQKELLFEWFGTDDRDIINQVRQSSPFW